MELRRRGREGRHLKGGEARREEEVEEEEEEGEKGA